MAVFDTFAKRLRRSRGEAPSLWQYDTVPPKLCVQIVHVWLDALGRYDRQRDAEYYKPNEAWELIHKVLAKEEGVHLLSHAVGQKIDRRSTPFDQCETYLLHGKVEQQISVVELSLRALQSDLYKYLSADTRKAAGISQSPAEGVKEVNQRFIEHGVGYKYVEGRFVRVDSEYLQAEAVEPLLRLLHEKGFTGTSDEFMRAHGHFRKGDYKSALNEALKAFESAAKTICAVRKWKTKDKPTAKDLVDVLFTNGLIEPALQSHFGGCRSMLESGLPWARNTKGGHGQGPEVVPVPPHVVAFALHQAASNILLIVQAHLARK